jgi:hypothetical protein
VLLTLVSIRKKVSGNNSSSFNSVYCVKRRSWLVAWRSNEGFSPRDHGRACIHLCFKKMETTQLLLERNPITSWALTTVSEHLPLILSTYHCFWAYTTGSDHSSLTQLVMITHHWFWALGTDTDHSVLILGSLCRFCSILITILSTRYGFSARASDSDHSVLILGSLCRFCSILITILSTQYGCSALGTESAEHSITRLCKRFTAPGVDGNITKT